MTHLRTGIAALVLLAFAPIVRADAKADDTVDRYLTRLGVTSVIAERLEHDFARATGEQREELAMRLAVVYADMLTAASPDADVDRWEARARALLDAAPDAATIDLRLGLARAAYVRAEAAAERGILRIGSPEDARAAAARLADLTTELDRIADEAHRRVQSLEKREESATDRDTTLLTAALSEGRRQRSIAHFLAGNAAVLVALATESAESAERALIHFGWILGAKPGARPELERLADQNLLYPHVAKSALGAALAHAIRGRADESAAWIAAVRHAERLPADIDELITTRQIQCLAATGRWSELAALVASMRSDMGAPSDDATPSLTTTHARLLAVLALGAPDSAPRAPVAEIRDAALAELVGRGELGHVLAIAAAFGTQGFGTDSFIGLEVRGLKAYDDARTAHGPDDNARRDPPTDPGVRRMYAAAAELFELALRAPGADAFPDAAAQTMLLVGVCRINALGDDAPDDATDPESWLTRAAEAIRDPARAAAAMRLAIHALDQRVSAGGASAVDAASRRDAMIDAFLDRFPDDPAAPSMIVRRVTTPGFDRVRGLTMLLAIPPSSPWHPAARHHAAAIAFELYRAAPPAEREWAARRYLDLEDPLLAADRRTASEGKRDAAERSALRARRIVEAALGLDAPDLPLADRALESIESLAALGLLDTAPIRGELAYRRAQIALIRGDHAAADALLAEAATADPTLARAGDKLRFDAAVRAWRASRRDDPGAPGSVAAAQRVADAGAALIDADPTALLGGSGAIVRSVSAEALADVYAATSDRAVAERAIVLLREVLDAAPNATAELRRLAELTEALGMLEESLGAWRTLVAGLPVGSDQWFDARVRHVTVLAHREPDRAREVLAQHVALYPDYGPEPWGPRLRAVHETLGGSR
jgi:hypothetical protein